MHPVIETVYKAADTFMSDYVTINEEKIASFTIEDIEEGVRYFSLPPYLKKMRQQVEPNVTYKIVHIFNAIQASLQYSFFTANADIRFNGIDSQWVIGILDETFAEFKVRSVTDVYRTKASIVERLIASNITMLRSRVATIEEVFAKLNFYEYGEAYADVDASLMPRASVSMPLWGWRRLMVRTCILPLTLHSSSALKNCSIPLKKRSMPMMY